MKTHHILLLAATSMLSACNRGMSTADYDAAWQEQQKHAQTQMDDYDRQAKRFDKLLDKWEEQVRRQDAILDATEKQLGIKK